MKKILSLFGLAVFFTLASETQAAVSCKVELKNPRGNVLEVLVGHGYNRQDACQQALGICDRARVNGRYQMPHYLRCEISRGPVLGRVLVTESCSARITGRRMGRTISRPFVASATGIRGTNVKALACERALRQCVYFLGANEDHRGPGRDVGPGRGRDHDRDGDYGRDGDHGREGDYGRDDDFGRGPWGSSGRGNIGRGMFCVAENGAVAFPNRTGLDASAIDPTPTPPRRNGEGRNGRH